MLTHLALSSILFYCAHSAVQRRPHNTSSRSTTSCKSLTPYIKCFDYASVETIDPPGLNLRAREYYAPNTTEIHLSAFGVDFHLILFADDHVLPPEATVTVVSAAGKEAVFSPTDLHVRYYYGYVANDFTTVVRGTIVNGMFVGRVITSDDTYVIEPTKIYGESITRAVEESVVYRLSDVEIPSNLNFCGGSLVFPGEASDDADQPEKKQTQERDAARDARSTSSPDEAKACKLLAVVDERFLNNIANGDKSIVMGLIGNAVAAADFQFRSTKLHNNFLVGIELADVKIYDTPGTYYVTSTDPLPFLNQFATYDFSKYCEAAFFTYRDFGQMLGLAFSAKQITSPAVGIFAKRAPCIDITNRDKNLNCSYNVLWVSQLLSGGNKVPTFMIGHTLTHELGHAFGAACHDTDTTSESCKTSLTQDCINGNYLMSAFTPLPPLSERSWLFSSCSINQMTKIIDARQNYLVDAQPATGKLYPWRPANCGNGEVDQGELCDCGRLDECLIA